MRKVVHNSALPVEEDRFGRAIHWESQPQVIDVQQADRGRSLRLLGFLAASKSCLADDESKNWISTITGQGRSCLGLLLLQGFGSGSSILARRRAE